MNEIKKAIIITASDWKYEFYSLSMILIEKTKDQGEIMKELMKNEYLKVHSKFISQTITKILKNIGKYSKQSIDATEEFQFFNEVKPIIEKRFNCEVDVVVEKDSNIRKSSQALPGRPAIVII